MESLEFPLSIEKENFIKEMIDNTEGGTQIDIMTTDEYVERLIQLTEQGAGVLDCSRVSLMPDRLIELLAEGPLRVIPSSDGLVSEVCEGSIGNDFSRQSGNFDVHNDGLIYDPRPEFVLLYCVDPGEGVADTLIADSRGVCQRFSETQVNILAHCEIEYINKTGAAIRHRALMKHPRTGERVLSLGPRGLVRPWVTQGQAREAPLLRDVIRTFGVMYDLLDESIVYRHQWKEGQALLFDNYAYLHAREARHRDPRRKLLRIWLSRLKLRSGLSIIPKGLPADRS